MQIVCQDKNVVEAEVAEDSDGAFCVYFLVMDDRQESFFMESELRAMLAAIEELK